MDQTFLIEDVALGFPLPDDELPERFDAQGKPGAGFVDSDGADLAFADTEGLDFCELLLDELVDGEFAVAVGGDEKAGVGDVGGSFEVGSWLGDGVLFGEDVSAFCDLLLHLRVVLHVLLIIFFLDLLLFSTDLLPLSILDHALLIPHHILIALTLEVFHPLPNEDVASAIDRNDVFHVMRVVERDYCVAVDLEG